jgi:predicted DNA-binding transcriptional regulator AlpA
MEPTTTREALLTATEVAAMLGIPASTLANWRYQGLGPRYLHIGRHVRYLVEDVDDWIRTQRVRHPRSVC